MNAGERIVVKREVASLLSQSEWTDIDLVLREHGFPVSDGWEDTSDNRKYNYIIAMMQMGTDEELQQLHSFVVQSAGTVPLGIDPWSSGHLRLFASHLAIHEGFVGLTGAALARYGIKCFVAHNSISPSAEWEDVIEYALKTCDAMVVFLHDGFKQSDWCDQEVGFALARRVPVLPLKFDLMPYGFIGKLQADTCTNDKPFEVADKVLHWLARTPAAQVSLTEGLVGALERSRSYDQTRSVVSALLEMPNFTPVQLERLERAATDNDQVEHATLKKESVPVLIHRLVVERGGTPPSAYDIEPF